MKSFHASCIVSAQIKWAEWTFEERLPQATLSIPASYPMGVSLQKALSSEKRTVTQSHIGVFLFHSISIQRKPVTSLTAPKRRQARGSLTHARRYPRPIDNWLFEQSSLQLKTLGAQKAFRAIALMEGAKRRTRTTSCHCTRQLYTYPSASLSLLEDIRRQVIAAVQ